MKYKYFQPTGVDPKGLGLKDKQDWLVVPVSQNRDSGPLDQSNFEVALAMLGGESKTVEVHRFDHGGPGWFEIILVSPQSKQAKILDNIESSLENYPILDDGNYSQKEHSLKCDAWESWAKEDSIIVLKVVLDLDDNCEIEINENELFNYCYESLNVDNSGCSLNTQDIKHNLRKLKSIELWSIIKTISCTKEYFNDLSHEIYHLIYQTAIKVTDYDTKDVLEVPDFIAIQYNPNQIKLFA